MTRGLPQNSTIEYPKICSNKMAKEEICEVTVHKRKQLLEVYSCNQGVGAFPLRETASHIIKKKRSQKCKQAWMRSAAHALCSFYKSTA
jgi:hypothetical protein